MTKTLGKESNKRGSIYEVINLDRAYFEQLKQILYKNNIEYKTRAEFYRARDRALIAGLVLTGLRASEIILLRKDQLLSEGDLVRIHKARTVKNSELRSKIPLPTRGVLGGFTRMITTYARDLPAESVLYPRGSGAGVDYTQHIGRRRVYQIVSALTGEYPHYFRAVNATIWARIFKGNAYMLKSFFGWKNLNSSSPYVKTFWEEKEGEINAVF